MRTIGLPFLCLPLVLAACASGGGNASNNAANVAAQEGLQDINAAIGGDELSPIPEAEDDMAANAARAGNGAGPGNVIANDSLPQRRAPPGMIANDSAPPLVQRIEPPQR